MHRIGRDHLLGAVLILLAQTCAVVLKLCRGSYPCEASHSATRAVMLSAL
jgi:hypothetical protein